MSDNTAGSEKTIILVAFCPSSDGFKLQPLIIIPRKKPLKDFTPPKNVLVYYKPKKATFDHAVISDVFIKRALASHVLRKNQVKPVLYIDTAPCHKKETVLAMCKKYNIQLEFIPQQFINLLQPAD